MKPNAGSPTACCSPNRGRLPPELVDMVIDYLHDDKDTLAECALVARSWVTAARMHLFHDVIVFHDRSSAPFGKFTSFLQSKPVIRPLIKTMCVNGYHPSDKRQGRIDAAILDAILSQLPSLDTLLIVNCFWTARNTEDASLSFHRASLKNLYVTYFSAEQERAQTKLEILRHFTKVDRLRLDHVWLGHFEIDNDEEERDNTGDDSEQAAAGNALRTRPTHPQISALTLSLADICLNFLAYLWRQPFMNSLTSLTVQDLFQASYLHHHEDLTFVGDAIRDTFCTRLAYFELDLPRLGPNDPPEKFADLHLSSCTVLTAARVNLLLQPYTPEEYPLEENAADTADTANNADPHDHAAGPHNHNAADDNHAAADKDGDREGGDGDDRQSTTSHASSSDTEDTPVAEPDDARPGPASPPPLTLYTAEEWRSLVVVLETLPPTVHTLTISVELPPSAAGFPPDDVHAHLADVPDWRALTAALRRFTNLEKLLWLGRADQGGPVVDVEFGGGAKKVVRRKLAAAAHVAQALSFR